MAEAILTIVDSFTKVCFPIMNLLILLFGLCSSVLSLHCSIFTVVVSMKIEPHVSYIKSLLSICSRLCMLLMSSIFVHFGLY